MKLVKFVDIVLYIKTPDTPDHVLLNVKLVKFVDIVLFQDS